MIYLAWLCAWIVLIALSALVTVGLDFGDDKANS